MFASALIIIFSVILLVYWFRYSCLLLLRNQVSQDMAVPAALDGRFSFPQVRRRVWVEEELDPLHQALARDYQVLTYLIEHAAGLELRGFEDRLLVLDFRIVEWWYRLTRTAAPRRARQALAEMASILAVLGQKLGEQAGAGSEA